MATSGKLSTSAWEGAYGNRYLEFTWNRVSYDVAAQTTTFEWKLTARGTYSGYVMGAPFYVVIDGEEEYFSEYRIKLYAGDEIASGRKTLQHNADGTKSFTVSVRAAIYKGSINCSGSKTFELTPVGAAFITAAPNFNDEESPTITYQNTVGNAISQLSAAISFTGETPDIAYRDISINGSAYTFNLTAAERDILRAGTVGSNTRKVRFYLRSIIDGEYFYSWKEVSYSVINATPTIAGSVIDVNTTTVALTGLNTTLIRGYSTAQATRTVEAQKKATITAEYTEHNGTKYTDKNKLFLNVNSNVFSFVATDSRKNTATTTITANMVDYIKPTANIDTTAQMDTAGNYQIRVSGNYYNDTFGFTSAAAANTIAIAYRYKEQGGTFSGWQTLSAALDGNTYSAIKTITGLNYRATYVFQCRIIDKLNTVLSAETTVRSFPVFHWGENDFVFEVPVEINGDLNINGNLLVNGTSAEATATAGTWQPTLNNSAAIVSYSVRQGWFSKVGKVVNIGWQVKATIKNGYSAASVAITGCPYTPAYAAFGGGIAHNVLLVQDFNFEGYAIDTTGKITVRAQPCNETEYANLEISSTAYYPTSGNNNVVLTMAGSICFITN